MLKKLAVPFLMLSLAAFGCSSSSSGTDGGKGGSGGSSTGGSGGSATGGSGGRAPGGTGGSNPDAGHDATSTGGTDGAATDSGGDTTSTDAGNLAAMALAMCMPDGGVGKTDNNAAMFTAEQFCALFLQTCGSMATVITMQNCVATYNSWSTGPSDGGSTFTHGQQGCRSYHLCNASLGGPASTHCPHAEGKSAADAGANTFCM